MVRERARAYYHNLSPEKKAELKKYRHEYYLANKERFARRSAIQYEMKKKKRALEEMGAGEACKQ